MFTANIYQFIRLLFFLLILGRFTPAYSGTGFYAATFKDAGARQESLQPGSDIITEIKQLNKSLETLLTSGNLNGCKNVVDLIIQKTGSNIIRDSVTLSESYYYIGIYYSFAKNYYESIRYLNAFIAIKENKNQFDERYIKALYNLGVIYGRMGDFNKHEDYSLKSLSAEINISGKLNPDLLRTYLSLIVAYIELQEYEKALDYANMSLVIVTANQPNADPSDLINLYNNLGVLYTRLADYSKAKLYLDKVELIYLYQNIAPDDNYINLINSQAITYDALRQSEKSNEYYEKGISMAISQNSPFAFNIINSYAIILANKGDKEKGEALLSGAMDRAKKIFGDDSRIFYEVLNNYANFLREYKIDNDRSIRYYLRCMDYLFANQNDIPLKNSVYIGYALSLAESGELLDALATVQSLLFSESKPGSGTEPYDNPDISEIKADRKTLNLLKTKYKILWDIYMSSPDLNILDAASKTSSLIVSLIEIVRINISEEESRLILGDKYRDSYLNAIRDFNLLYSKTDDHQFLEKAFTYSEKSKVAGLLTSTRELKATQFHIPSDIADSERKLQRDISLFNERINVESEREYPDTILINRWKENLLEATRLRDSLVLVFEKQYPEYYAIKYNTQVASLEDIPKITGRKGNYINYIISDTTLYVFVANGKYTQLLTVKIDTLFFVMIKEFRNLLSHRPSSNNARTAFEKYQQLGYGLYDILINPVRKYLVSDKLVISPDNIISYLPFEALPTSPDSGERILYRELPYLMDEFDISYTYSATFMAESGNKKYSIKNTSVVFAPDYSENIDVQSLLMNRQALPATLTNLPFARQEAEYVANITGGKLFLNKNAKESVFKAESSGSDIIHLAMHTLLDDRDPMQSTLIFSPEVDTTQDRFLKTYEIYGIPLNAKMVVLSSCNTGTGILSSGEGILSLARGFIYSGSQSVVMSMWEVEDRSGTDIIEVFYDNLKKGNSKSIALRKSRKSYLEKADQLRSHPYFWSTLVIYGNNSPLYYSKLPIIAIFIIILCLTAITILYFRKRKYS